MDDEWDTVKESPPGNSSVWGTKFRRKKEEKTELIHLYILPNRKTKWQPKREKIPNKDFIPPS